MNTLQIQYGIWERRYPQSFTEGWQHSQTPCILSPPVMKLLTSIGLAIFFLLKQVKDKGRRQYDGEEEDQPRVVRYYLQGRTEALHNVSSVLEKKHNNFPWNVIFIVIGWDILRLIILGIEIQPLYSMEPYYTGWFIQNSSENFTRISVWTGLVMKNAVFWGVVPCRCSRLNRRFGGLYRLHLQGRKIRERRTSVSSFIVTAVKTSNLTGLVMFLFWTMQDNL
jgi:hypothetical protein